MLFIAKQVADATGLKNGSHAISMFAKQGGKDETFLRVSDLQRLSHNMIGRGWDGSKVKSTSYLLTEPQAYRLLLRGHAPQSEAFRKWVTEEEAKSYLNDQH
ncbi:BRO family protein [Aeromonas veronii]|uniref:BRO family protein n=1 Tax=Aeromonas veronii TaxID=654 RepID=UPI001D095834